MFERNITSTSFKLRRCSYILAKGNLYDIESRVSTMELGSLKAEQASLDSGSRGTYGHSISQPTMHSHVYSAHMAPITERYEDLHLSEWKENPGGLTLPGVSLLPVYWPAQKCVSLTSWSGGTSCFLLCAWGIFFSF